MSTHRINVSLPGDVLALLDSHTSATNTPRSAYITSAVRRALVADALARVADHNAGRLPYADELDGVEEDTAA